MQNGDRILFALCGTLSLFSSANAESNVGGLDDDQMARFKVHVTQMARPSHSFASEVIVGTELPPQGITFYEIPSEYGMQQYRYTIVNGRPVLVDSQTRRVIHIMR